MALCRFFSIFFCPTYNAFKESRSESWIIFWDMLMEISWKDPDCFWTLHFIFSVRWKLSRIQRVKLECSDFLHQFPEWFLVSYLYTVLLIREFLNSRVNFTSLHDVRLNAFKSCLVRISIFLVCHEHHISKWWIAGWFLPYFYLLLK